MKKVLVICLVAVICLISVSGCNNSANSNEEIKQNPVEEPGKEPEEETLSFDVDQTAMCNYMQYDDCYTINNGWYYGNHEDSSGFGFAMYRIDSPNDVTWIKKDYIAEKLVVKDEYIYFTLRQNFGSNQDLYRCRIGGNDLTKIQNGNVDYFQIYKNKIYFTQGKDPDDVENRLYRCKLNGKKKKLVLKKNVYFPYFVDNYLFYQDDKDKERLHLYNTETKEDLRITKKRCWQYFIDGDTVFYLGAKKRDKGSNLIKHNINTGEETVLYKKVRNLNTYKNKILFTYDKDDDKLYSIDKNGDNVALVAKESNICNISIFNKKLYYLTIQANTNYYDRLYKSNINGSSKKTIVDFRY